MRGGIVQVMRNKIELFELGAWGEQGGRERGHQERQELQPGSNF